MSKLSDFLGGIGGIGGGGIATPFVIKTLEDMETERQYFTASGSFEVPDDGVVYITAIGGGGAASTVNADPSTTKGGDTVIDIQGIGPIVAGGGNGGGFFGSLLGYGGKVELPDDLYGMDGYTLSELPYDANIDVGMGFGAQRIRRFPWSQPVLYRENGTIGLNYLYVYGNYVSSETVNMYGSGGSVSSSPSRPRGRFGGYGSGPVSSGVYPGAGGGVVHQLPVKVRSGDLITVTIGARGVSFESDPSPKSNGSSGYALFVFAKREQS